MLRITKKLKKIYTMIILFITIFGIIQPVVCGANQTISGSGSDTFVARQYATRIKTTDPANGGENGIVTRRILLKGQNWNFSNGDGLIVFCAENRCSFSDTELITKEHMVSLLTKDYFKQLKSLFADGIKAEVAMAQMEF